MNVVYVDRTDVVEGMVLRVNIFGLWEKLTIPNVEKLCFPVSLACLSSGITNIIDFFIESLEQRNPGSYLC